MRNHIEEVMVCLLSDDLVHIVKAQISDDVLVTLPEFAVLN